MALSMITNESYHYVFGLLCFVLIISGGSVNGRQLISQARPDPNKPAPFARWLVSESSWGVLRILPILKMNLCFSSGVNEPSPIRLKLGSSCGVKPIHRSLKSTIADDLGGAPFGNVVSFSDGLPKKGTGVPYFYLTTLDPTARYALKDHRSSLTISEYPIGTCAKADPENPTCSKITLTGKLSELDAESTEVVTAKSYLFAKHAEMKDWPTDHNFQVFKLDIEEIFLINYFGGPKPLTVDQYLHYGKDEVTAIL